MKLIYITIKSIKKSQLDKIYTWYNDPKMSRYFRSKTRTKERIVEILSRKKPPTYNYIINKDAKDVGYIFITKKYNYCYLSIMIDKKYWGRGCGKQAMILIEDKAKKLKIKRVVLGLYKENKRAVALYKNLDYIQTKKEGNIIVMEKRL